MVGFARSAARDAVSGLYNSLLYISCLVVLLLYLLLLFVLFSFAFVFYLYWLLNVRILLFLSRGDSASLFVAPKSLIGGSSLSSKDTMEGVLKKALSQKVSSCEWTS